MSVVDMIPGQFGIISHLKSDDAAQVRKLLSMGFIPGRKIMLDSMHNNGPRVVRIGETVIAIDQDLSKVVRLEDNS